MERRYAPRLPPRQQPEEPRGRELMYGLAAVVIVAFGAVIWNFYGAVNTPRITPDVQAYKMLPPTQTTSPDLAESGDDANALTSAETDVTPRPGPETPITAAPPATAPELAQRPVLSQTPSFTADGPFVAQLAAVQSEAAATIAWQRLSSRAPALFQQSQMDVQRADLGARGVLYRLRAGYFADRENVGLFCERIRSMGQDCIAVQR